MELGSRIVIVGGIPDFLSWITDSKAQDFGFHKQNFPFHQKSCYFFFLPALLNLNFKQTHSLKALIDLHSYNFYKLRKHNLKLRF